MPERTRIINGILVALFGVLVLIAWALALAYLFALDAQAGTVTGGMVAGASNPRAKVRGWNVGQTPGTMASATNAVVEETSGVYKLELTAAESAYDFIDILWMSDDSDYVFEHYSAKLWGVDYDESTGTIDADDITSVGISYWPGTGANAVTITVLTTSTLVPIPSAVVLVKNSGQTVGLAKGTTNASGQVILALDDGSYKVLISDYTQHTFTTPESLTVSGTTAATYYGTAFDPGSPTTVTACIVYGWLKKLDGTALSGKTITAMLRANDYPAGFDANGDGTNDTGIGFAKTAVSDTTDADGYWSMELTYSARVLRYTDGAETRYSFRSSDGGVAHDVKVPSAASAMFDTLTTYTLTSKP